MHFEEVEGVAAMLRDEAGYHEPLNPWELAADLGIRVEFGKRKKRSNLRCENGVWIARIDPSEPPRRQATQLAHEIGHALAIRYGLPNTERVAWRFACALLLPRDDFERAASRRDGWVHEIAEGNPFVSHELAARRLVGLRSTYVLRVVDVRPESRRYTVASDGWHCPPEPTPIEEEATAAALDAGGPVEIVGGVKSWVVEEGGYLRVLVLSDAEVFGCG